VKIAMIGIRGVPAQYGGLETCADELGQRLVRRGHEVIVYCRRGYWDDSAGEYEGMRRIVLPSLKTKYSDTFTHSLISMVHVIGQKPDVIVAFNPGIASLCTIPKAFGLPVALNPDGFDWRRKKWGPVSRALIFASAWLCTKVVDQMIIDAKSVCDFYNERFDCRPPAIYIPNGANLEPAEASEVDSEAQAAILDAYGVAKDRYVLFLSRHVPENSCEYILDAFRDVETDMKLLFGGSGETAYARRLRATDDRRVLFPGGIYDPVHIKVLHHNCYCVVHGNQPGGTSLGLLKAMGYGACVVTLNTPDNASAVGDGGVLFELSAADLAGKLQYLIGHPEEVRTRRRHAIERIRDEYLWEAVAERYEGALEGIARRRGKIAGG
jgi:glycosyltransferase involved in cell wall biosynthesis